MADCNYTNGLLAVKETRLLGEKLLRFPEMTAQEVLRVLAENGFGGGEAQDVESLCAAEEATLDAFIREYAPTKADSIYLLAPRDFHNAKAICKAELLSQPAEEMLGPEGLIPIPALMAAIKNRDFDSLGKELAVAVQTVLEGENLSGAEIGAIFEAAMYRHLMRAMRTKPILGPLLAQKADMTNILTAMRCSTFEQAEPLFVEGGKLRKNRLAKLFDADMGGGNPLMGTSYEVFCALCLRAKERGMPQSEAERALESFEAEYFFEKRYELEGRAPFLYYVFRRRAEIMNVRIILVCLGAGRSAHEIRKRLRAI